MINELYSHSPGLAGKKLCFLKSREGLPGLKIIVAGLPGTKKLSGLETLSMYYELLYVYHSNPRGKSNSNGVESK